MKMIRLAICTEKAIIVSEIKHIFPKQLESKKPMDTFVTKNEHDDQTSVYFDIEADEVMAIGEKMEAINEQAYMNGYNWEAFLQHYLKLNNPDLLDGLGADSEAGCYVAIYDKAQTGKADGLIEVINGLVNNPAKIYSFLEANGDDIEWD